MIKIDNLVLNEQYQINQEILNDEIIFIIAEIMS